MGNVSQNVPQAAISTSHTVKDHTDIKWVLLHLQLHCKYTHSLRTLANGSGIVMWQSTYVHTYVVCIITYYSMPQVHATVQCLIDLYERTGCQKVEEYTKGP